MYVYVVRWNPTHPVLERKDREAKEVKDARKVDWETGELRPKWHPSRWGEFAGWVVAGLAGVAVIFCGISSMLTPPTNSVRIEANPTVAHYMQNPAAAFESTPKPTKTPHLEKTATKEARIAEQTATKEARIGEQTATREAKLSATPTPTRTATSTKTPKPTKTEKPTKTPKPTNTEKPTRTPKPTSTEKPTKTPKPTSTPKLLCEEAKEIARVIRDEYPQVWQEIRQNHPGLIP